MRIDARAASTSGPVSSLLLESGDTWVRVSLDGLLLYDVPAEEWPDFTKAAVNVTAIPPDLPAQDWASGPARAQGSAFLRQGERFQLLISALHLASQLPLPALFEDEPYDTLAAITTFHSRRFTDERGNFLFVPSTSIQAELLGSAGVDMAQQMLAVGYLFEFSIQDEHGNPTCLFYRPYNTGFASSSTWPDELQHLRARIEAERNP